MQDSKNWSLVNCFSTSEASEGFDNPEEALHVSGAIFGHCSLFFSQHGGVFSNSGGQESSNSYETVGLFQ